MDYLYVAPSVQDESVTLYIDDQNLRKRFRFQFSIPMVREDTKYFVFLDSYNRVSYNLVRVSFKVCTVTTPSDYDYTNYENYLYYDNFEKKLYFPAGCEIKEYSCSGVNDDLSSLVLDNEFIGERDNKFFLQSDVLRDNIFYYTTDFSICSSNYFLFPTDRILLHTNPREFAVKLFRPIAEITNKLLGVFFSSIGFDNEQDYVYKELLHNFYYNKDSLSFSFDDFCFSNYFIVSYENEEISSSSLRDSTFYNFFRKTKVYNLDNYSQAMNCFYFNYSNGEDVSSLLPSGIDNTYLTSPIFKNNTNSSNGGYISYDIGEVFNDKNKVIDYSQQDNSIHNIFNGDYIENFSEGDNIIINNYYTETIDKTSDSNLLHNIYVAVLEIRTLLEDFDDSFGNTTNNFFTSTGDTINYYCKPNKYWHDYYSDRLRTTAQEHLGFLYDPFVTFRYLFTAFSGFTNSNNDIVLDIPSITYNGVIIIPQTYFNFTSYMENDLPILKTIHDLYLTFVDFAVVTFIFHLGYMKWREMMSL